MTKEQRVNVPIRFSDKYVAVHPFICFFKALAVSCMAQDHNSNKECINPEYILNLGV
jgi:hypothetical protein